MCGDVRGAYCAPRGPAGPGPPPRSPRGEARRRPWSFRLKLLCVLLPLLFRMSTSFQSPDQGAFLRGVCLSSRLTPSAESHDLRAGLLLGRSPHRIARHGLQIPLLPKGAFGVPEDEMAPDGI